jgi:AraC-like DNA-binding protein
MQTVRPFLQHIRQNKKLPVRIVSPDFGHLTAQEAATLVIPKRSPYFFFMFMLEGRGHHQVDTQKYDLVPDELIFVTPNQLHEQQIIERGSRFLKIGFDESCLSLLPKQYPFLLNTHTKQKISFSPSASLRVKAVFSILLELLQDWDTAPELILAHLNSLLTEINTAYFGHSEVSRRTTSSCYAGFQLLVEQRLTDQPGVRQIAETLGINLNGLYKTVKQHSGLSPKDYITKRLILEAQRRLYLTPHLSVKELAFELGFNDPDYFSRLFKKVTGQRVSQFLADLSGY